MCTYYYEDENWIIKDCSGGGTLFISKKTGKKYHVLWGLESRNYVPYNPLKEAIIIPENHDGTRDRGDYPRCCELVRIYDERLGEVPIPLIKDRPLRREWVIP